MRRTVLFTVFLIVLSALPAATHAASLSLSPSASTFLVGSTFDVSIILNTNGKSVNSLSASLSFPPDMLQVVSPSAGRSVVEVWTSTPKFDNRTGILSLQGDIPRGITASGDIVTTVTFRVKSMGQAVLKFLDSTTLLSGSGSKANILSELGNAVFNLELPPPKGPFISSRSYPNESRWYNSHSGAFQMISSSPEKVQGYSYALSDDPSIIPDDINEGIKTIVSYDALSDGIQYFIAKEFKKGVWGNTSVYGIKIDTVPPNDFAIDISSNQNTANHQPIVRFAATDVLSGIDHYELKISPFSPDGVVSDTDPFIMATSPYLSLPLPHGTYIVTVRAYDKAGNYNEQSRRFVITNPIFALSASEGFIFNGYTVSWVWVGGLLLLCGGGMIAYEKYKNKKKI